MNVLALTGRRVDAADAEAARFPLTRAREVRLAITSAMREMEAGALVCSAACGTDLLALDAAEELGIPAWIVLSFDRERFRETSVVDRPGDWGPKYDHHVDVAQQRGTLRVIDDVDDELVAYRLTLDAILDLAESLAAGSDNEHPRKSSGQVNAIAVWEGAPRGPDDFTAAFIEQAHQRGIFVRQLLTTAG